MGGAAGRSERSGAAGRSGGSGAASRSGGSGAASGGQPAAVQDYIDAILAEHRPLFDRLHGLILCARPDAALVLSYGMPTYKRGAQRLFLGAWKHGVSIYGWQQDQDGGFVDRHPELKTSTGTIRLRPEDAALISDAEFLGLVQAAVDTG